jgi:hypothetical protein
VDKEAIKGFLRWLEEATQMELQNKQREILDAYERVHGREGKSDLNLALRLLDEEIVARLALKKPG